jgi:hypothetical protein
MGTANIVATFTMMVPVGAAHDDLLPIEPEAPGSPPRTADPSARELRREKARDEVDPVPVVRFRRTGRVESPCANAVPGHSAAASGDRAAPVRKVAVGAHFFLRFPDFAASAAGTLSRNIRSALPK